MAAQNRRAPQGIAAARTASAGAGSDPDDDAPGARPGPNKPILAGAAIAGAILIAVPLLLVGANNHEDKKTQVEPVAAGSDANTVLDGEEDHEGLGDFVAQSPTPSPTPKPSKSASAKPTLPKEEKTAKKADKNADTNTDKKTKKKSATSQVAKSPDLTNILIKNVSNGTCLTLPATTADPTRQARCSGSDKSQRWTFEKSAVAGPGGHNLYVIRNKKNKLCLDVPDYGGKGVGTNVGEYYCDKTVKDNQLYWLEEKPDASYFIHNFASAQLCLDVSGYSDPQPGRGMTLFPCSDYDDHKWRFTNG
ncbi:RICIN domain-containing protein [Streptomyces sp. NPDC005065]|uniref:RICIN domain-containing protein n=1 Tax=unclassified Streptomyces TaxID=2593676 RepID=UPI0033AA4192